MAVDARAISQGRTQQLWEVRITDDDGRLVATGQVRLQNITPREWPMHVPHEVHGSGHPIVLVRR